jgi:RimJ/RimL family protein N-acetyltransferase
MGTNVRRSGSVNRGSNVHPRTWHTTARIALRELCASDLDDLVRLDCDPRVMRYIGDGSTLTRAEVEERLQRSLGVYELYPGLGRWYALRRDTGAYIGWFVLNYVPKTIEVEVGYRLLPAAWGRGFATEGARALVRYGFDTLGLERIIGLTHPDNAASQRVLQKAGLQDAGWGRYYDRDLRVFAADRANATR